MSDRRYDPVDVIGGAVTILVGAIAAGISLTYPMGSIVAIGPGVFPLGLGALLILLGAGIAATGFIKGGEMPSMNLRATVAVSASIAAFGLLIGPTGLFPATLAAVILARLAEPGFRLRTVTMLGLALAVLCWGIFIFALGLPIPAVKGVF